MQIDPTVTAAPAVPPFPSAPPADMVPAAPLADLAPTGSDDGVAEAADWTNPAAAAALRSSVDMLRVIEDGMLRSYDDVDRVRVLVSDLAVTDEILQAADKSIRTDASSSNDQFLPLVVTAGTGVQMAQARLDSKEIAQTWPIERGDILAAVRRARAISANVADQLDPRSRFDR